MSTLLPIAKKVISNQINKIKSRIMRKIRPNTPKKVSNREIKSLENIINTPKIVIENPSIVVKPEIATKAKIDDKPEIAIKPKNVNKSYNELKNRVIKQLKNNF